MSPDLYEYPGLPVSDAGAQYAPMLYTYDSLSAPTLTTVAVPMMFDEMLVPSLETPPTTIESPATYVCGTSVFTLMFPFAALHAGVPV